MLFIPYPDEREVIDRIHKVRNEEYALLRITKTMVDKNNTDCNGIFRTMLKKLGIVDYDTLEHGSKNGAKIEAKYIMKEKTDILPMNFYIVNGVRGDRRMTIPLIAKRVKDKELYVGDLLYFSSCYDKTGLLKIYIINLTHNSPDSEQIKKENEADPINKLFEDIKPILKTILMENKKYPNDKGAGKEAPKDVGQTLEKIMKVKTNNSPGADINGLIELKGKGSKGTKDTLMTLRPSFEGTYIASVESEDSHRVKVFPLYYGYISKKHEGCKDLYITIGTKEAPQNQHGFYLEVDETNELVKMMGPDKSKSKSEMVAFWSFDALENSLLTKHPATLWITADKEVVDNVVWFNYKKIEFSRSPKFSAFIALIKSGVITYDWRGHTSIENIYSGINKGNAWRIKPQFKNELFGTMESVDFD